MILAIGRIVGETAALIYTAGTMAQIARPCMQSGRTLAVHMYVLLGRGTAHATRPMPRPSCCWCIVFGMNALSGAYVATKKIDEEDEQWTR